LPFLNEYWQEMVMLRDVTRLESNVYPITAPLTTRDDWRGDASPGEQDVAAIQAHILERYNMRSAIGNCLHGAQLLNDEGMATALCRAVNDWLTNQWLNQDARLRASIVVPPQDPFAAAEEIERMAEDR